MDYYLLKEDKRIRQPLKFDNYFNEKEEDFKGVVIKEEILPITKMIDYKKKRRLFKSNHIFSDKIKDLLDLQELELDFFGIFITTKNLKNQYVYWEMKTNTLKQVEIEKGKKDTRFKLSSAVLDKDIILLALYEKQEYLIVREDLAESIMRHYPIGIKFKQLIIY